MIQLHEKQSIVYNDLYTNPLYRFAVVVCSRGWGKSHLGGVSALTSVWELLELDENVPNKNVYIIAPTFDQVMEIYYPLLMYDFGLEEYDVHFTKDEAKFVFPKRTSLKLLSYESVERMRGKGAYFVVWDEVSSCKRGVKPKEAWNSIIKPCITTRWSYKHARRFGAKFPGRGLIIGTPKGFNFFKEMYDTPDSDDEWGRFHFSYKEAPLLDIKEIEKERNNMDPVEFASEYEASFKESGLSVFYMFDRDIHVRGPRHQFGTLQPFIEKSADTPAEDVHLGIDFNVGLQCTSAFAIRGPEKVVEVLDEMKGHPDTETLALAIKAKYIDKGHKVYAYPDPTGKSRKTSAAVGVTDFTILQEVGVNIRARSHSPPIIDSVKATNRRLKTASGLVRFYVRPECKGVIESLEKTKWVDNNPDVALIDKTEGKEHYSDGLRYAMEWLFPIKDNLRAVGVSHVF
jgi:hypothetical protein